MSPNKLCLDSTTRNDPFSILVKSASNLRHASASLAFGHLILLVLVLTQGLTLHQWAFILYYFPAFGNFRSVSTVVFDLAFSPSCLTSRSSARLLLAFLTIPCFSPGGITTPRMWSLSPIRIHISAI
ncbi:unnamed protein product [Merluccius merluccius]